MLAALPFMLAGVFWEWGLLPQLRADLAGLARRITAKPGVRGAKTLAPVGSAVIGMYFSFRSKTRAT